MGGPTAHVSLNYRRKKQNTIARTCSMTVLKKSTTVFHALYYNQPSKWHHIFRNSSGTILASFLWSIRIQTMEHFCWFVFYNNNGTFDLHFCWKFWQVVWRVRKRKANCATIMLFRWSVLLSNVGFHQSMHKKLVSYCKKSCRNVYHYFLLCIL